MSWRRQLAKFVALFRRSKPVDDLEKEIRSHLEMEEQENLESEMPPEEAHYSALRRFGNATLVQERSREMWGWVSVETLWQDLRYGLRGLRKNPGFTAVAVLTLALGIGANTAIFSIVSGVLLRKPPVREPDRVVMVLSINRAKGWGYGPEHPASAPDFLDWRQESHSFEEMAAIAPWGDFSLTGEGEPQRVAGTQVSANFFHLLGVNPSLGRTFAEGEDQRGRDHVAIVGYGLWQTHFASDPTVVGKIIRLNGESYTVVGVIPASYKLFSPTFASQIWIPLAFDSKHLGPAGRQSRSFYVVGRLKPEVKAEQAQAEMVAIARRLEQSYPEADKGWDASLISLQEFQIQDFHIRPALMLLTGTVGLVLLIACANIAGLLLARGAGRQHEIAVRSALGAGRWRLIRQFLSENVLIAIAGAGAGLLLAWWGTKILHAALSFNEWVNSLEFGIDAPVLTFTISLSLLTVLLFGLAPALHVSKSDLLATLKEGGRTAGVGATRVKARRVFVVAEVTLALVLLTGAGLVIKSFLETISANPGFNPRGLLTTRVSLPTSKYGSPSQQAAFFQQVTDKLQNLPGAVSAAATVSLPLSGEPGSLPFSVEGQPTLPPLERPHASYYVVSRDYLQTMEIPLLSGRTFTDLDYQSTSRVVLVNEAFALRFFPKESAIGQHISLDTENGVSSPWLEVVGVVANVKDWFGQPGYHPQLYVPYVQAPTADMTLVVRTTGDPVALAPGVRAAVWSVDKDQPLGNLMTMGQSIEAGGEAGHRVMGELLGIFAGLALILATVGIYGLIAHGVTQRTHELGIRMALGAERGRVLRVVVGEGMRLAVLGLLIGSAFAYSLPHLFGAAFEGFSVHPFWILIIAPALVALAALLASYIPARRAAKVDPMVALRYE
jgi:putative ABC transport system permease protein